MLTSGENVTCSCGGCAVIMNELPNASDLVRRGTRTGHERGRSFRA